jgi:hypothetical protein
VRVDLVDGPQEPVPEKARRCQSAREDRQL